MKVVVITILILVLFFTGALMFKNYVQFHAEALLNRLDKLDEAITSENWSRAEESLKLIKEDWSNMKHILELSIEHNDLDRAEVAIAKLNRYIENRDKTLTLGELAELKFVVDLMMRKEELKLANLF